MELVRQTKGQDKLKRVGKSLKENNREQKHLTLHESRRRRRVLLEIDAANLRVHLYDETVKLPRSMSERRPAALQRTQQRRFLLIGTIK